MTRRIFVAGLTVLAVLLALNHPGRLRAQSLSLPTYTTAQAAQGKQVYDQTCAACHGSNLDDGEFAPPLKGVDFRSALGREVCGDVIRRDDANAAQCAGTLGDDAYAQLLAYLVQENGVAASARALPSDPALLRTAMLPSAAGGPGGGLTIGVAIPPPPSRPNPLDRLTPVTDAMLSNPPEGEWLTWRRAFDAQGFSPLAPDHAGTTSANLRLAWSWALPNGAERSDAARPRRRDVRARATATRCRRSTPPPATCSGSTRGACRAVRIRP